MTNENLQRVAAESPYHGPIVVEGVRELRASVSSLLEKLAHVLGECGMSEKEIAKIPAIKEARKLLSE